MKDCGCGKPNPPKVQELQKDRGQECIVREDTKVNKITLN